MRNFIYLLVGIFFGFFLNNLLHTNYSSNEESAVSINDTDEEDDDGDEDDEIDRVIIFNNKMSIKMDQEDILSSGIRSTLFDNQINSYDITSRALSISSSSYFEMVNEYDFLVLQLQKMMEKLNYNNSKYDRLLELYEVQGSVALKDIEKVKHNIENVKLDIQEINLKTKVLLNNIKIKFGDLILDDIKTDRKFYNSLINKNASFILLEDCEIENSYFIDNKILNFLTYWTVNTTLHSEVGLYYIADKYYNPGQKLIAHSSSNTKVSGFLIPESSLVYFQGQIWVYIFNENESVYTREAIDKILYKNNDEVFVPFEYSQVNIVVEGGQILLAEEFRSQIMREDDD